MRPQKSTPRADHRIQESQRAQESVRLSEKFQNLKSLTVELAYFSPEGNSRNRQMKYTVNLDHARSVFLFDCANDECVRGDYDLSEALTRAVAGRQSRVAGEIRCRGWLSKTTIDDIRCDHLLRYTLSLEYGVREAKESIALQPV